MPTDRGDNASNSSLNSECRNLVDNWSRTRFFFMMFDHFFLSGDSKSEAPCTCPMLRCRQQFDNATEMLRHLKQCDRFDEGEVWCPGCNRCEPFPIMDKDHCSCPRTREKETFGFKMRKLGGSIHRRCAGPGSQRERRTSLVTAPPVATVASIARPQPCSPSSGRVQDIVNTLDSTSLNSALQELPAESVEPIKPGKRAYLDDGPPKMYANFAYSETSGTSSDMIPLPFGDFGSSSSFNAPGFSDKMAMPHNTTWIPAISPQSTSAISRQDHVYGIMNNSLRARDNSHDSHTTYSNIHVPNPEDSHVSSSSVSWLVSSLSSTCDGLHMARQEPVINGWQILDRGILSSPGQIEGPLQPRSPWRSSVHESNITHDAVDALDWALHDYKIDNPGSLSLTSMSRILAPNRRHKSLLFEHQPSSHDLHIGPRRSSETRHFSAASDVTLVNDGATCLEVVDSKPLDTARHQSWPRCPSSRSKSEGPDLKLSTGLTYYHKQAQRFKCNFDNCQKGFIRSDNLKRHQLREHGQED